MGDGDSEREAGRRALAAVGFEIRDVDDPRRALDTPEALSRCVRTGLSRRGCGPREMSEETGLPLEACVTLATTGTGSISEAMRALTWLGIVPVTLPHPQAMGGESHEGA